MNQGSMYSASLSRSQGRPGFSVIFRHPVRRDPATGRPGLRVRRGLGTQDEGDAERLVGELNEILGNPQFWEPAAKSRATTLFDERVVEIFFHGLEASADTPFKVRESILPIPSRDDGYQRVILLGTTGAGKTTLVRQLMGTSPEERFPSTSTAKTTVHDTEVILTPGGDYRAAISFSSIDEIRDHLNDCLGAAVLAAYRGGPDHEVFRHLLNHVGQRVRFSYILGNGPTTGFDDFDDEDSLLSETTPSAVDQDLTETNELLASALDTIRGLAAEHGDLIREELRASDEGDQRVVDELFEEELDRLLRADEKCSALGDRLMDEVERRFDLLEVGTLTRSRQGWPTTWEWSTDDRESFLHEVNRFSSNYAGRFGQLLTPLVSGVRVAGPFAPAWIVGEVPRLVLVDGEGLGHNPRTSASLPTEVTRRIAESDAIVLVDNATQPMQPTSVAVMEELASSGNASKLVFAFTHFDEVKGDNIPTAQARARHVLASAENVLVAIGERLGPFAERVLRKRVEQHRFFLEAIHEPLTEEGAGRRTRSQLNKLLAGISSPEVVVGASDSRPVYDRVALPLAIQKAAENFHDSWLPLLGLRVKSGVSKEHWTRVRALSRRLATPGWTDQYDTLRPVADLLKELRDQLWLQIQRPTVWTGPEPSDDLKQGLFDELANTLSERILDLVSRRLRFDRVPEWQKAYYESGTGSSYRRANIIADEIYEPAAPVPSVVPTPERNRFLTEVVAAVEESVSSVGAQLR